MISVGTGLHLSTSSGCSEPVEGQTGPRLGARSRDRALHVIRTCSSGSECSMVSFGFSGRQLSPRIILPAFTRRSRSITCIFSLGPLLFPSLRVAAFLHWEDSSTGPA